jgi:hypothetical protein
MSARQEMADLLEQWLQMTRAEAGAIRSAKWASLRNIQAAKAGLQQRLTQAKEQWEAENPGKVLGGAGENAFGAEIGRLLSLETRNAELLTAKLRRAHAQRESLNEAARNLRNVHETYALRPKGAWNCYS